MADEQKKVIIDVTIGNTDAVKKIAELKQQTKDLKAQQKELDTTTVEGREAYEALGQQIVAVNNESRKYQKEVQNNIKEQNAQTGSLDILKAQLSSMTAEYNAMSEEMRNSEGGEAMAAQMLATSDALKTAEGGVGDFHRGIGDYENAITNALKTGNPFIDNLVKMGASSGGLKDTFAMAKSGVMGFGKSLLALLANPIVLIIAAIVVTLKLLFDVFKSFDPVMDMMEQGLAAIAAVFSVLKDTVLSVITGQKSLTEAISGTGEAMTKAAQAAIEMAKAQQDLDDMNLKASVNQKKYKNQVDELMLQARNRTLTEAERIELLNKVQDIEKQAFEERKALADQEVKIAQLGIISKHNLSKQEIALLKEKGVEYAIALKERKGITDEEVKALADALGGQYEAANESIKIREKAQNQIDGLQDKAAEDAKKRQEKQQEIALKNVQTLLAIDKAKMEASTNATSKDFKTKQAHELAMYSLEEASAKKSLELQKQFGKITGAEYTNQMTLLGLNRKAFANKQLQDTNAEFIQQAEQIKGLLKQSVEDQVKEIEGAYKEAVDSLSSIPKPNPLGLTEAEYTAALEDYEQLVTRAGETQIALEKEKQEKIKAVRLAGEASTAADIQKIIDEQYGGDLAKYQNNAQEKLKVEVKSLDDLIAKRKEAGLETYNEEAKLQKAKADLIRTNLDVELMTSNLTAQQRYEAKRQALEAERSLYEGNAKAQAEIDAESMGAYKTMMDEKEAAFRKWADATMEVLGGVDTLMGALEERQLNDAKKANDTKKADLAKRLKDGLISQEAYDKAVAASDANLAAEEAKVARQQAIRQKAMSLFQVGIDTASGIMKTIGEMGMPAAIPFIVGVGITAAAQTAAILAAPIPEAANGMLIHGSSHAAGGAVIEAEGGETIINKKSSSMFLPLLSLINELGGGVPFTGPMADGGFAVRANQQGQGSTIDPAALADAMGQIKIVATIEDIRREDAKYMAIEARASY